jgi:hypothetical protein
MVHERQIEIELEHFWRLSVSARVGACDGSRTPNRVIVSRVSGIYLIAIERRIITKNT